MFHQGYPEGIFGSVHPPDVREFSDIIDLNLVDYRSFLLGVIVYGVVHGTALDLCLRPGSAQVGLESGMPRPGSWGTATEDSLSSKLRDSFRSHNGRELLGARVCTRKHPELWPVSASSQHSETNGRVCSPRA